MTVNIVIADNVDLALEGMKTVLRQHGAFQVVGTYQMLSDMLNVLGDVRPDVILLGDRLEPDLDVLALVDQVQAAAPRARILILSYLSDGLIVQELFTVGAMGYLYKNDPLSHYLVEAIQTVMRGRPYLSPTANSEYLLAMQSDRAGWQLDAEAREILRQLAQGLRPQEIALLRAVPVRRVYGVCERLRRRFGAETNIQLIALAAEEGFLP
ncbi:MAG TPA: response regulator transcription factor [Aggregatilinea sp.]|uniref:response regulator transcription factor n=1 Tax=Aggregatilinea sp. TaxID=2806333 RepID=UPI002C1887E2|nr:response regulator transcription factor [Aggregatilinea sp.]HML21010.1 response regulator transcription factor [Aggregatilinea sp.]